MKTKTETTFNLNRDGGKGTKEWSDKSYNICIGCEHGCLYCYAKSRRCRFEAPMRIPGNWEKQRINPRIDRFGAEVQPVGTVMFPTSHDITPQFAPESLRTIKNLVQKNDVLIVTKPHLSVIKILCRQLAEHQNRILFRFTIGSLNAELCKFWEPGAPAPAERIAALEHAYKKGFATSVSIEPMLDSVDGTCELVAALEPHVTDSIWLGKMQRVPQKLNTHVPGFAAARQKIAEQQADSEILNLVAKLESHDKIKWKDSIKAVLARHDLRLPSAN